MDHCRPVVEAGIGRCIDTDVGLIWMCAPQVQESAGAETRKGVYVTAAEQYDLSGSKGTANFVMKWAKDSRHESYINVMELKGVTRSVTGVLL